MSGMRTAVATDEPLPDGETDFVRFLKARLADEEAALAGKRALVDAVLAVPMWPSKEAAEAAERALQGLAAAHAGHPEYRQEWRP
jgi:hypothetical protein